MKKIIIPSSQLDSPKEQIKEIQKILLDRIAQELAKGDISRTNLEALKVCIAVEKDLNGEGDGEGEINPLERKKTEQLLRVLEKAK